MAELALEPLVVVSSQGEPKEFARRFGATFGGGATFALFAKSLGVFAPASYLAASGKLSALSRGRCLAAAAAAARLPMIDCTCHNSAHCAGAASSWRAAHTVRD